MPVLGSAWQVVSTRPSRRQGTVPWCHTHLVLKSEISLLNKVNSVLTNNWICFLKDKTDFGITGIDLLKCVKLVYGIREISFLKWVNVVFELIEICFVNVLKPVFFLNYWDQFIERMKLIFKNVFIEIFFWKELKLVYWREWN